MRAHSSSHTPDRMDPAFGAHSASKRRSASIHLLSSSTRSAVEITPVPSMLRNETAELLADIDGLPVLVRLLLKDIPAGTQADLVAKGADIHSLLSSTLEKLVDR